MGRRPDRCLGGPPLSTRRVTWLKLLENRAGMPPRSGLVGSAALLVAWYQQRVSAKASGRRSLSHAAVPPDRAASRAYLRSSRIEQDPASRDLDQRRRPDRLEEMVSNPALVPGCFPRDPPALRIGVGRLRMQQPERRPSWRRTPRTRRPSHEAGVRAQLQWVLQGRNSCPCHVKRFGMQAGPQLLNEANS
jgi:hypothetical protein